MSTSGAVSVPIEPARVRTRRRKQVGVGKSLRRQFLALLVVIATTPLLVFGVWELQNGHSYGLARDNAVAEQHSASDRAAAVILSRFAEITADLETAARITDPVNLDSSDRAAILGSLLATNRGFRSASFIDAAGRETERISRIVPTSLLELRTLVGSEVFETPIATGRAYFGPISIDATSGMPSMEIAVPFTDHRTGEASGVLLTEVRLKEVWETLGAVGVPGRSVTTYLLDRGGVVLAHPNPSVVLAGTVFRPEIRDGFQSGLRGEDGVVTIEEIDLGSQELFLVTESPKGEVLGPYYRDLTNRLLAIGAAVIFAMGAAFVVARRMAKPVLDLAEAASALSAGEWSQRVNVERDDELGQLGSAFNEMADQITTQIGALEEGNRRLKSTLASKNRFLAAVSHELRTPLTAVVGFADLLRDTDSDLTVSDRHEMVNLIADQGSDLVDIIKDLLVTAQAETGELDVTLVPVNLAAQVAQVLEARQHKDRTSVTMDGSDIRAEGDPSRVRQIIRNLLSNATKYGGETIRIALSQHGITAHLAVIDNGPGVSEVERDRIFEPFHRIPHGDETHESVGIGLAVSRDLAHLMNGNLTYRRHNNETFFELTLPAAPAPNPSSTTPQARTITAKPDTRQLVNSTPPNTTGD